MIAHLRGTLIGKHPGGAIVDVGGVGYQVTIPLSTFRAIGDLGSEVHLHVHTHVREDALALFGFLTPLEKELFVRLIGVSGVGPKTAVAVLSGLGADELIGVVGRRDVKGLARIPGIGRKTAERLVLELADRLDSLAAFATTASATASLSQPALRDDLVSALMNLGYNARAASQAAAEALQDPGGPSNGFESLLKTALRSLSR